MDKGARIVTPGAGVGLVTSLPVRLRLVAAKKPLKAASE
jgi:hypothetical protein